MTHFSDSIRVGDVFYGLANADKGTALPAIMVREFGAIATATASAVFSAFAATGAASATINGSLASGGVATLDVPRNVTITSTGNESARTFTITGTAEYGAAMTEQITGPNATTVSGVKAFKTITAVSVSGALTSTQVKGGTGVAIGFPVRIGDKGKVLGVFGDGKPESTLTIVTGLSASGTSTATTADVRGTFTTGNAPNGSIAFSAVVLVGDNSTKTGTYGADQA